MSEKCSNCGKSANEIRRAWEEGSAMDAEKRRKKAGGVEEVRVQRDSPWITSRITRQPHPTDPLLLGRLRHVFKYLSLQNSR